MSTVDARRIQRFNRTKRMIDLLIIVATSPVTIPASALAAMLIASNMGRPILFKQPRLGLNEKVFQIYKFRTMSEERTNDGHLLADERRLTTVGAALRKLSVDELPQLVNVIRGEMSLVGPRPLFPRYLPYYRSRERRRHLVRPGLTGLAQVSGRNLVGWDARLCLDAKYVETASLLLDLKLLIRTVGTVMTSRGLAVVAGRSGAPLDVERTYTSGNLIRLRPLSRNDLGLRVKWVADQRTSEYMQWPASVTIDSTTEWFDQIEDADNRVDVVAVTKQTGEPVGMAGLKKLANGSWEYYVFLNPDRHGLGYGTEVSMLITEWAFENLRCDRISLSVHAENQSAIAIYRKLGFQILDERSSRVCMTKKKPA